MFVFKPLRIARITISKRQPKNTHVTTRLVGANMAFNYLAGPHKKKELAKATIVPRVYITTNVTTLPLSIALNPLDDSRDITMPATMQPNQHLIRVLKESVGHKLLLGSTLS